MAKGKTPTPQEIYKARKQREEQEKLALLPPGLFNHGNTCFMNSVLQGLIATRLLSDLVHFAPIPPSTQAHSATLLASRRSPQLTNGHDLAGEYEKKWVNTMPIGDMFLSVLHRAWEAQYHRRRENLSPKPLLTTLGKKYDQYLDFAQQDAHEFLRILLDAMSMEELDVIKKTNPPPPKKRRRTSAPPLPPPEDAPIALADMIFGGKLASILVCQKCKHVSQTYEDFSDLSLSIKQEDYTHVKKRDRFKSLAKRLGAVVSLGTDDPPPRAHSVPPTERPDGFGEQLPPTIVAEEPRRRSLDIPAEDRGQEVDHPVRLNGVSVVITPDDKRVEFMDQPKAEKKEKTKKEDDAWAKLGRRLSLGLGSKASKEKERKGRSAERASRDLSYPDLAATASRSSTSEQNPEIRLSRASRSLERSRDSPGPVTPKSRPTSVSSVRVVPTVPPITIAAPQPIVAPAVTGVTRSKSPKPPKPSAGETAYLRQILADVSTGSDAVWLKLGNSLPGVEECLRMFTAVEVLDGENMVGCRRCWKIANGQYVPRVRPLDEDYTNPLDEDGDSEDSADHHESPVVPVKVESPSTRPLLPTSLSSPLIYSLSSIKAAESSSSLPLVTPHSSSSDSALGRSRFGDDTDTITPPSSASSVQSLPLSPSQEVETPPATKVTVIPPTPSADTFETSEDGDRNVSSLESIVEGVEVPPSSPPLNGVGNVHPPDANGLHPPSARPHHQRHPSDESTDGSSGDESDVSATSGQVSSAVSEDARSDAESGAPAKPRAKPKKPKPVIMRPAYKRYLIAVPPPVLVIHLKRFQQVSKTMISFSNGFKKLDDYVTFPETLDLTPFLAPKKEDYGLRSSKKGTKGKRPAAERCMYRLYAVVVHIGNMLGGHYISYVALPNAADIASIPNAPAAITPTATPTSPPTSPMSDPVPMAESPSSAQERQWAYISDTVVRLTTLEEVLKAKAYICMYERV
ncbi:Ubiquitin carboxyl-terminal hydrolase [Mycena venus]|uniref:Ubiquitin carboxyl-terminal hydrolase n=1 Tax=Mycena venus TaxID=2733690 RepID=A0A8H7DA25_9AGAR|nr:Ubiquitin carboxyl-terminal hydrolase [Mycena venus]